MSNYNQISNFPFDRAFTTQPISSSIEFTPEEIDRMNFLFSKGDTRAGDVGGKVDNEYRISNIKFYYPDESSFWIFEKLNYVIELNNRHIWNFDLNGYESFQYTEYHASEGGKYEFHADIDYADRRGAADPQTRKLSLSVILSEPGVDYEGGDFQIMIGNQPVTLAQAKGAVLIFPSWVLHRVTPVTKGVRKSLVVWVTGPKFR